MSIWKRLMDPKLCKVLEIVKSGEHYHLKKLSELTGVPIATVSRLVHKLVEEHILDSITVGKMTFYKVHDSPEVHQLLEEVHDE